MSASTSHPVLHERWRLASLWAGMLAGPAVWLMLLQFNYAASYAACEMRRTWFLHLAVIVGLLLVGSAGWAAWRARHQSLAHVAEETLPLSDQTRVQRSNWMSMAGVTLCAWFMLAILALEIPIVVLHECQ